MPSNSPFALEPLFAKHAGGDVGCIVGDRLTPPSASAINRSHPPFNGNPSFDENPAASGFQQQTTYSAMLATASLHQNAS